MCNLTYSYTYTEGSYVPDVLSSVFSLSQYFLMLPPGSCFTIHPFCKEKIFLCCIPFVQFSIFSLFLTYSWIQIYPGIHILSHYVPTQLVIVSINIQEVIVYVSPDLLTHHF